MPTGVLEVGGRDDGAEDAVVREAECVARPRPGNAPGQRVGGVGVVDPAGQLGRPGGERVLVDPPAVGNRDAGWRPVGEEPEPPQEVGVDRATAGDLGDDVSVGGQGGEGGRPAATVAATAERWRVGVEDGEAAEDPPAAGVADDEVVAVDEGERDGEGEPGVVGVEGSDPGLVGGRADVRGDGRRPVAERFARGPADIGDRGAVPRIRGREDVAAADLVGADRRGG